jgi:hypothetical protein
MSTSERVARRSTCPRDRLPSWITFQAHRPGAARQKLYGTDEAAMRGYVRRSAELPALRTASTRLKASDDTHQ